MEIEVASSESEVVREGETGGETRIDSGVEAGSGWGVGVHACTAVVVVSVSVTTSVRRGRSFIISVNENPKTKVTAKIECETTKRI